MIDEKRYVLMPTAEITQAMLDNTIPYGIHYSPMPVIIAGVEHQILKWKGDKPAELWQEYPVYTNTEMNDYIATHATLIPPSQPT